MVLGTYAIALGMALSFTLIGTLLANIGVGEGLAVTGSGTDDGSRH